MLYAKTTTTKLAHLKAKAAECRHIVPFVIELLTPSVVAELDGKGKHGQHLRAALMHLEAAYSLMRAADRLLDTQALERHLLDCAESCQKACVAMVPQFHFLAHFGEQAEWAGNPRFYSTFEDEACNADLVLIIASCCLRDFSSLVLAKIDLLERCR